MNQQAPQDFVFIHVFLFHTFGFVLLNSHVIKWGKNVGKQKQKKER